jgi:hypothetical protein
MSSVIYNSYVRDVITGSIDMDTDSFKMMLVGSTYDAIADETKKDTHSKRSDITNEITGVGYTAGGNAATASVGAIDTTNNRVEVTFTISNWTSATISNTYGGVIYKSRGGASSADELVAYVAFSNSPVSCTSGTLSVSFTSNLRFQN